MLQLDQPMYGLAATPATASLSAEAVAMAVGVAACAAGRVAAMAAVRARTRTALVVRRPGAVGAYEDDRMGRTSSGGFGGVRVRVRVVVVNLLGKADF
jgi:hypothetical protein